MARICIVYATTDGHTRKICERLRESIGRAGHEAVLVPIEQAGAADVLACDKIVVGASIRYGRHSPLVHRFIEVNARALAARPGALFSVNIVARKPRKNQPATNPYLRKLLRQIPWNPTEVDVFAGKLDYPRYGFFDRLMIRFIMWMTDGPTDPATVMEFTDWQRVEAFAVRVARM